MKSQQKVQAIMNTKLVHSYLLNKVEKLNSNSIVIIWIA